MSKSDVKKVPSPKKTQSPAATNNFRVNSPKKTEDTSQQGSFATPKKGSNNKSASLLPTASSANSARKSTPNLKNPVSLINTAQKGPITPSPKNEVVSNTPTPIAGESHSMTASLNTVDLNIIKSDTHVESYLDTHNSSAHPGSIAVNIVMNTSSISTYATPTAQSANGANDSELIKVCVRIRPMLKEEKELPPSATTPGSSSAATIGAIAATTGSATAWVWDKNTMYNPQNKDVTYSYDHLFYPEHNNTQIYDSVVRGVVDSAMHGYHGSVFSYGQTASGKTFTMNGGPTQPGIIPQAIYHCFNAVNTFPDREFLLRVSYLEVYNEQIKDLLGMEPLPIKIQHDPKLGTVISGIKEQVVLNPQQVIALIRSGEAHRHVGSTDMNEKSSRAHTLFKLIIESKERTKHGDKSNSAPVKVSTLNLVDLAGSESAKMTNSKGDRLREAKHINQSLLTLSTIIQRLSEQSHNPARKQHLPYRDSKLTRLLESALDGNARISIICTMSPAARCVDESTNTLKFASRAKLIKMHAKVNETVDDKTLLRAYREEIEQLKAKLQQFETLSLSTNTSAKHHRFSGSAGSFEGLEDSPDWDGFAGSAAEGGRLSVGSIASADRAEEEQIMLQMIAEMERLILKADLTKTDKDTLMVNNGRNSSGGGGRGSGSSKHKKKRSKVSLMGSSASSNALLSPHSDATPNTFKNSGALRSVNSEVICSPGRSSGTSDNAKELVDCMSVLGSPRLIPLGHRKTHKTPPVLATPEQKPAAQQTPASKTSSVASSGGGRPKLTSAKSMILPKSGSFLLSASKAHTAAAIIAAANADSTDSLDIKVQPTPIKTQYRDLVGSPLGSSSSVDTYGKGTWKDVPTPAAFRSQDEMDEAEAAVAAQAALIASQSTPSAVRFAALDVSFEVDEEGGEVSLEAEETVETAGVDAVLSTPNGTLIARTPSSRKYSVETFVGGKIDHFESITPRAQQQSVNNSGTPKGKQKKRSTPNNSSSSSAFFPAASTDEELRLAPTATVSPPASRTPKRGLSRAQTMPMHTMLSLSQSEDWDLVDASSPANPAGFSGKSKKQIFKTGSTDSGSASAKQVSSIKEEAVTDASIGVSTDANVATATAVASTTTTEIPLPHPAKVDTYFELNSADVTLVEEESDDEGAEEEQEDAAAEEEQEEAGQESESVLYGVTKMLTFLKGYIAKSNTKPQGYTIEDLRSHNRSFSDSHLHNGDAGGLFAEALGSSYHPKRLSTGSTEADSHDHHPHGHSESLDFVSRAAYERLRLDLKLKEADNRFLQEELENKDKMLGMLTEGLKEVEISQTQWLTTNQELSYELDRSLQQNKALKNEITRLKEQLMELQGPQR